MDNIAREERRVSVRKNNKDKGSVGKNRVECMKGSV